MRILAVISGRYGERHVDNIRNHGPDEWQIEVWRAPAVLPPVIDEPEEFLPPTFAPADLILAFGEHKGVAELIPEIARMSGARAVLAPIDNEAWLPRGLARQLSGWLSDMGIACATPKPLCTLTEQGYNMGRRERISYDDPHLAEFARHFGRPELRLTLDPETHLITAAEVVRDAVCGNARHIAEGLIGISADEAEQKAGLLHHHYPCLASMGVDADYDDTLMHVSGNIVKDNVADQVKPFKSARYFAPGRRAS